MLYGDYRCIPGRAFDWMARCLRAYRTSTTSCLAICSCINGGLWAWRLATNAYAESQVIGIVVQRLGCTCSIEVYPCTVLFIHPSLTCCYEPALAIYWSVCSSEAARCRVPCLPSRTGELERDSRVCDPNEGCCPLREVLVVMAFLVATACLCKSSCPFRRLS